MRPVRVCDMRRIEGYQGVRWGYLTKWKGLRAGAVGPGSVPKLQGRCAEAASCKWPLRLLWRIAGMRQRGWDAT